MDCGMAVIADKGDWALPGDTIGAAWRYSRCLPGNIVESISLQMRQCGILACNMTERLIAASHHNSKWYIGYAVYKIPSRGTASSICTGTGNKLISCPGTGESP